MSIRAKIAEAGIAASFLAGVLCNVDAASAAGFSRADADTDILFDEGTVVSRFGATYVRPGRTFDTYLGQNATSSTPYTDPFFSPSASLKVQFGKPFSCAATYVQPVGANASYDSQAQNAELVTSIANGNPLPNPTSRMAFITNEYGGTCKLKYDLGPGALHVLGGVFVESFNYREDTWLGFVKLRDDGSLGYRLGVAYDIPEIAMRAQLLYRSQTHHAAHGTYTASDMALGRGAPLTADAIGSGNLPQSVKFSLQSGVARGWLAYSSVTWTQWSIVPNFQYTVVGLTSSNKVFNFKDSWTIQAGIGHSFTDKISGTVNVTWDKGVGRQADINTDLWTLGTGVEFQTDWGVLGLGGALLISSPGSQLNSAGATYDATAKRNLGLAAGATYTIKY
ncbi:outer membrane protein transport protein [Bradyrhizobium sp. SZCCHNS1054]|uniref:outer membrane protein transport protein n=1 Tax=Bradyrhizobium sp. SZCCHNS1054 TaxID=3057301 RepID=UPI0029167D32|nr:outer membrane protein transport protein [Bradyrhizobium sp. SZCCHNS1054]